MTSSLEADDHEAPPDTVYVLGVKVFEGRLTSPVTVPREITGVGTRTFPNGSEYTGDFVAGEAEGQGRVRYPDGASGYAGEFRGNARHGQGVYTSTALRVAYTGGWVKDKRHGYGVEDSHDGRYAGEWAAGLRHGFGTDERLGVRYEGAFVEDRRVGRGVLVDLKTGLSLDTLWAEDRPVVRPTRLEVVLPVLERMPEDPVAAVGGGKGPASDGAKKRADQGKGKKAAAGELLDDLEDMYEYDEPPPPPRPILPLSVVAGSALPPVVVSALPDPPPPPQRVRRRKGKPRKPTPEPVVIPFTETGRVVRAELLRLEIPGALLDHRGKGGAAAGAAAKKSAGSAEAVPAITASTPGVTLKPFMFAPASADSPAFPALYQVPALDRKDGTYAVSDLVLPKDLPAGLYALRLADHTPPGAVGATPLAPVDIILEVTASPDQHDPKQKAGSQQQKKQPAAAAQKK